MWIIYLSSSGYQVGFCCKTNAWGTEGDNVALERKNKAKLNIMYKPHLDYLNKLQKKILWHN